MQLVLSTSSFQHAIYEHIASFNFATLRKSEIEGGGEEEKRNMLKLKTCGEVHGERKHVTVTRWLQNWIDAGVQNRVGSAGTCMQRGEKIGKTNGRVGNPLSTVHSQLPWLSSVDQDHCASIVQ
uniref:Uncharacterized protein n=1 Tax=Palpitomonas bilix TaxID=652834 RepID=A0A7S3GIB5_9EUKA|mmetsp:Transcript_50483/g.130112  ORF Transcript_50483/g.130112 Transcript_50483/m.130112 type:complete len:124 (+) Transcript_50483:479-850(+)